MRRSVIYQGRVQGVGFRATASAVATERPVTGWVRNEPDGSVRLEAQGEPEAVAEFLRAVHGAMGRFIVSAETVSLPDVPGEAGFRIRS